MYGIWNSNFDMYDLFFETKKEAKKAVKYFQKEYNISKEEMPIGEIELYKSFKEFKEDYER